MNMRKRRPVWLNLLLPLCLAAAGCDFDGTSTDTTNTLTGVVRGADGSPAANARVTARSGELILGLQGSAAWGVLGEARADAQGRFTLRVRSREDVYLEARDGAGGGNGADLFFARYPADSLPSGGKLGDLKLAAPGSIQGRIADTSLEGYSTLRIGVVGFRVFEAFGAPSDSGSIAFRLEGVPAGALTLRALGIEKGSSGGERVLPGSLPEVKAEAGADVDVGTLRFQD
jgi:hypothetical protein